ncbi:MAG: glycoside hydrolase family protein [Proteobacteria bacterium]|nr:glycoside hydrolase family protein [Pseudomonadota bacterium]
MVDTSYLDAIKQFEGYTAEARWDYAQNSNGYGTRARYAGEVIDKAEADKRFSDAVSKAANFVDKFAPNLDDGSKAALTSLTYNAGTAWAQSGLGQAVASGDLDKARSLFLQYNKAGGSVVDGLVQRRLQEVAWFGQGNPAVQAAGASFAEMASAASASAITAAAPASAPAELTTAAEQVEPATQSDRTGDPAPSFSSFGSDQVLLSLLAHMSNSATDNNRDNDRKTDRKSYGNHIDPDVRIQSG